MSSEFTPKFTEYRVIDVNGMTEDEFMRYVQHEAMFAGDMTRSQNVDGGVAYNGTTERTGYGGLPVTVHTAIVHKS